MIIKPSSLIIIKCNVCLSLHFRNLNRTGITTNWHTEDIEYPARDAIYLIFIRYHAMREHWWMTTAKFSLVTILIEFNAWHSIEIQESRKNKCEATK